MTFYRAFKFARNSDAKMGKFKKSYTMFLESSVCPRQFDFGILEVPSLGNFSVFSLNWHLIKKYRLLLFYHRTVWEFKRLHIFK